MREENRLNVRAFHLADLARFELSPNECWLRLEDLDLEKFEQTLIMRDRYNPLQEEVFCWRYEYMYGTSGLVPDRRHKCDGFSGCSRTDVQFEASAAGIYNKENGYVYITIHILYSTKH